MAHRPIRQPRRTVRGAAAAAALALLPVLAIADPAEAATVTTSCTPVEAANWKVVGTWGADSRWYHFDTIRAYKTQSGGYGITGFRVTDSYDGNQRWWDYSGSGVQKTPTYYVGFSMRARSVNSSMTVRVRLANGLTTSCTMRDPF